jgi:hypothetical protein
MTKSPVPTETGEAVCPACGAAIKAPAAARRRRVQCPKCREVVFIGVPPSPEVEAPAPASAPASATPELPGMAPETQGRIQSLEARVEALEAALRDAMAAGVATGGHGPQRKLLWVTVEPGQEPPFSPEQSQALFHNLRDVRLQAITIRTPAEDAHARAHAEWFKMVFERAGWIVRGPEEIPPDTAVSGLSLAVPELPVAKEAAATYLALKAAGFEPIPVLETGVSEAGGNTNGIALTLPRGKAA